jgi:hypothetical protein
MLYFFENFVLDPGSRRAPLRKCAHRGAAPGVWFCRFHLNGRSSSGFVRRPWSLLNNADKPDAFARDCANQSLLVAVVADSGPCRIDPCR